MRMQQVAQPASTVGGYALSKQMLLALLLPTFAYVGWLVYNSSYVVRNFKDCQPKDRQRKQGIGITCVVSAKKYTWVKNLVLVLQCA